MFSVELTAKEKEILRYMVIVVPTSFALFLCSYQNVVRSYNTTMLALSYQYGFTSRSLLGTLYHPLDRLLPVDMINYEMVMRTAQIVTGLFFLFLLWFIYICLKRCDEKSMKACEYLALFFVAFTVTTFSGGYNFFRVDLFMVIVSLLCTLIIVGGKAEWLVIPLVAIGVMFHQGYVFMFFNIPLVLLVYKFLSSDKKGKVKYALLFTISFLLGSVLFLWFEFFSRSNGAEYFEQIVDEARKLSLNGYHTTLLYHEVLGIDLSSSEADLHKINFTQLPILTVLFMPYIVLTVRFFVRLFKQAKDWVSRIKYITVFIGAGTMLPDFILKIDYGRWVYAVITYYAVVILALCMMRDQLVTQELHLIYAQAKGKSWTFILVLLPVFFVPLWDVDINSFLEHAGWWFNDHFLHWYNF